MALRLGITWKLLLWCLTLVGLFCLTLVPLFQGLGQMGRQAEAIVRVNYRTVEASEAMIQDLLALLEDRGRQQILGKSEYGQAAAQDLERFAQALNAMVEQGAEPRPLWLDMRRSHGQALKGLDGPPAQSLPEDLVNSWIDTLAAIQRTHRRDIGDSLLELDQRGRDLGRLGLLGLLVSVAVALGGSAALALYLNRSLGRLRRGVSRLGGEGGFQPIALASGDELGQLAQAFNHMGRRLEEEERRRAEFISMLSHEIRTPLTSIREAVNLVREGVLGPVNQRQGQFLEVSSQEVARLSELLNRLMQVSSLEARDLAIRCEPLEAGALIERMVERARPAALAKGIELDLLLPEGPVDLMGDADQLGQVLLNLLGNALKYAPTGSRVMVCLAARDGQAVLGVRDQGPGIPEEERDYVFQKYYRGKALAERVDGVGLGLAISQRVVTAHGGRIWLETAPGGGSAFFFAIPLDGPAPADREA